MRKSPLEMQTVDVNRLANGVLSLVRTDMARRGITLRTELAPLPAIMADRISVQQVLLQLLTNAIEAMDAVEGARVLGIRTRQNGTGVEIVVSDTGPGVSQEHSAKLFKEFFTTKPDGVGLGLSIARAIVEAHGGDIALVDSEGWSGASFRITLPASPDGLVRH